MDTILRAKGPKKYYGSGEMQVRALDGVELEAERGEFLAVMGPSGSGKSTLLHMLGGLDTPTAGSVRVAGTELAGMDEASAAAFRRRRIGFIFQDHQLIPMLNTWENIIFPVAMDNREPDVDFIMGLVSLLGLRDKLDCLPCRLSGGQQQRVAIARALSAKPSIVLADEPTGNLDRGTGEDVMALLQKAGREFHQTIVMSTHNPEVAGLADRVVEMGDGRIQSSSIRSISRRINDASLPASS